MIDNYIIFRHFLRISAFSNRKYLNWTSRVLFDPFRIVLILSNAIFSIVAIIRSRKINLLLILLV